MASESSSSFTARVASILALLVLPAVLGAQGGNGTLAGRVSASGEPVSGAAVIVTGTGRGTQTRSDGTYRIMPARQANPREPVALSAIGASFATLSKLDPASLKQRWTLDNRGLDFNDLTVEFFESAVVTGARQGR